MPSQTVVCKLAVGCMAGFVLACGNCAQLEEGRERLKTVTTKIALEILSHEAIVREAYCDGVGVWTWGVGITEVSGHTVFPRYRDRPQTMRWCLEMYLRVLKQNYASAVADCFSGIELSESQFGAALSFHYNTGGIKAATWVEEWKRGDVVASRLAFMNWSKPAQIIPRRTKERDLFFDGVWAADGLVLEIPVNKPAYEPDPARASPVDVRAILNVLIGNETDQ
jgi:lysozyme